MIKPKVLMRQPSPGALLKISAPSWTTLSWGLGFIRAMLQTYAEDEFLRYIGAKH